MGERAIRGRPGLESREKKKMTLARKRNRHGGVALGKRVDKPCGSFGVGDGTVNFADAMRRRGVGGERGKSG